MKKLFTFIFWPALSGLVFALVLLQTPRLLSLLPGLERYLAPSTASSPAPQPALASQTFNDAFKHAAPAVVSINNKQDFERSQPIYLNPQLRGILTYPDTSTSLGSGVILSPDGLIVTSYHVIYDPELEQQLDQEIIVTLNGGHTLEAQLVSLDAPNDLALLKVDSPTPLPYLEPADLGALEVGDVVLAIGNPRNIGQSMSYGIISALLQRDDSFMIQTDAAINPGNSGGALIDTNGKLIGINSTIVSESGGSEGISFATPANKAVQLYEEFLVSGPSGYLGVDTEPYPLEKGRFQFNQDVQGFKVNHVMRDSQAEKAGIQSDDIITGVNGRKLLLRNEMDLPEAVEAINTLASLAPGETVTIEVFRNGRFITLDATLGIGVPRIYDSGQ